MAELRGGIQIDDMVLGSIVRPTDQLGRQQPRILGSFGILNMAIKCGMPPPIEVPDQFWSQDIADDTKNTIAVIACPCGHEPRVEVGGLNSCGECERYYFFAIDRVLVFNSPKGREPEPSSELQSES